MDCYTVRIIKSINLEFSSIESNVVVWFFSKLFQNVPKYGLVMLNLRQSFFVMISETQCHFDFCLSDIGRMKITHEKLPNL